MLGRQQIAGIPTAVSELFKNAYDAYASQVVVDYLRADGQLLLRDDGVGMTEGDFLNRWLTVGTDSKIRGGISPPPVPVGAEIRPTLGEKGIGRLAIAALGPQVLVMTMARTDVLAANQGGVSPEYRPGENLTSPLVVALLQWTLFESPGITLDDIEVPLRVLKDPSHLTRNLINELVQDVEANLQELSHKVPSDIESRVLSQLISLLETDVLALTNLPGPSFAREGHGTQFLVTPVDELMPAAIEGDGEGKTSDLQRMLLGFNNTMTRTHGRMPMKASFIYHPLADLPRDLIDDSQFWTPEDFDRVDHEVVGDFDEFGQFDGTVSVYGGEPVHHVISWPRARGTPTRCGPFRLSMGYVQGNARESQLSPEDFALMQGKLERVAGLYVYRDGLRVLPYGRPDFDWLNIEERRTRRVSTYFFSYRRMFGAVELTSSYNGQLQEKAGREGFRDNVALRQLREILTNFLVQLAADFFKEGGTYADEFVERRQELTKTEQVRQARARRIRGKREAFRRQLEAALDAFDRGDPLRELGEVEQTYHRNLQGAELDIEVDLVTALMNAEETARQSVAAIRNRYAVARPRGIGLSRVLNRDWNTYLRMYDGFVGKDIARAEEAVSRDLDHAAIRLGVEREVRLRQNATVTATLAEARSLLSSGIRTLRDELEETSRRVNDLTKLALRTIDTAIRQVEGELASSAFAALSDDAAASRRQQLERQLLDEIAEQSDRLSVLHSALSSVGRMASGPAPEEELEALEEEVLTLREQAELDLELAQLGMAVQVVNHEFSSSIATVSRNLRLLRPWADLNPELLGIQRELAGAFEHLESYLNLLTPLQRRLYRHAVDITGQEISDFLAGLFSERLRRHEIRVITTRAFASHTIRGYPSTYYPVFVNLVDNAIYWLQDSPVPRQIELDLDGLAMTVTDTGPGVSTRDREAIFESGFSRKPGGRGLGLKISRDVLRRNGWDLELDDPAPNRGARFRIVPRFMLESEETDEMDGAEDGAT